MRKLSRLIPAGLTLAFLPSMVTAQAKLASRWDREPLGHDAVHYDALIRLADSGSRFEAAVTTRWRLKGRGPIRIDLDPVYTIESLTLGGKPATYAREGDELVITLPVGTGTEVETKVAYNGDPPPFDTTISDDGLVQRGRGPSRKVFADNWPDRARKWLASQDHPSDKATINWTIEVPAALTVVANGKLTGTEAIAGGRKRWRFTMEEPIPVYTMVLGAARLATTNLKPACAVRCVPVSVVTYPEDSAFAASVPFRRAAEMIDYFSKLFGPYPYGELRHVQSSTIFGGMENSTVIFYSEGGYSRRNMGEGVVAHETAHQWFGDAVTEDDWHHIWLSEGFATYGGTLWSEHIGGDSGLRASMKFSRENLVKSESRNRPILDSLVPNRMALLSSNAYGKGGWVLHTLRGLVGDSVFFNGLRSYYADFKHKTALSSDFAAAMSKAANTDLTWYFEQALTQPGHPVLSMKVTVQGGHATVAFEQVQPAAWGLFRLPNFEIEVGGRTIVVPIMERTASTVFHWEGSKPPDVVVDPKVWWLMEVKKAS